MDTRNRQLRYGTKAVLELAGESRKGLIDRMPGMSELEPGLLTLPGAAVPGRH